jgi:hypothetical protein
VGYDNVKKHCFDGSLLMTVYLTQLG